MIACSWSGSLDDEAGTARQTSVQITINGEDVSQCCHRLGSTDTGVINGSTLTLDVTQPDGTIAAIIYRASSLGQYNTQVAGEKNAVNRANTDAAQQATDTAATNTVTTDISTLTTAENNLTGDLTTLANDVTTTGKDLQTTRNDAAHGQGDNCYNVSSTVSYDATSTVGVRRRRHHQLRPDHPDPRRDHHHRRHHPHRRSSHPHPKRVGGIFALHRDLGPEYVYSP